MFQKKDRDNERGLLKRTFIFKKSFRRILAIIITVGSVFIIITSGAANAKYDLKPGEKSFFDITAPFDIVILEEGMTINRGEKIISKGDMVTEEIYNLLVGLNIINDGEARWIYYASLLALTCLMAVFLILYISNFNRSVIENINEMSVYCLIIILTLAISRFVSEYSLLLIPVFISVLLISILIDIRLAIITNILLAIVISLFTHGNLTFLIMSVISGTFSAYIVSRAKQRSSLSASGLFIGLINALIIIIMGMIYRHEISQIILSCIEGALNGLISIVITIGTLPFWESVFGIITPLKLLELANPNQPLLKRLLTEAPGTYHHSLMVGNLAENATEAIGGDSLLARVGAYYHDVGKIKRPNFFKENQMQDNPHDRMKSSLSTLVITSHTVDGDEIALKYKIPPAIRSIIKQHHGTTLVAYFFHKAVKEAKEGTIKEEDFRYPGPRPMSREAAVVMLADSVEAAVRSMAEKTEGKIEGLIRKIIRDKLDDGQLDLCSLTLKDLNLISRGFIEVFSGYFHAREQYPEIVAGTDGEKLISGGIEVP